VWEGVAEEKRRSASSPLLFPFPLSYRHGYPSLSVMFSLAWALISSAVCLVLESSTHTLWGAIDVLRGEECSWPELLRLDSGDKILSLRFTIDTLGLA
jgi:hypothetical protein